MTAPTNAPADAPPAASNRLARTVRLQRHALAGLTGLFMLAVGLGFGLGRSPHAPHAPAAAAREITHYTAGGDRLYRIWDTGDIEYLTIDFAHGSVEGVPSWARLRIDDSLTHDRMGNMIRVPGR